MAASSDEKPSNVKKNVRLQSERLGVWFMEREIKSPFDIGKKFDSIISAAPLYIRLFTDVFKIAPGMFTLFLLSRIWSGTEAAMLMHFGNQLLRTIEVGLVTGKQDTREILISVASRLSFIVFVSVLNWWSDKILSTLRSRIQHHFDLIIMRAKLAKDMPTSQEPKDNDENVSSKAAWDAFQEILSFFMSAITAASQLAVVTHISRSTGGYGFTLLCLAKPVFDTVSERSLWDSVFLSYVDNNHHIRMKALEALAGEKYKQDIISGDLGQYLLDEYSKSRQRLGDVSQETPYTLYSKQQTPWLEVMREVIADLPMIYCAISAIRQPSQLSVASIAILHHSSDSLRWSVTFLFRYTERFRRSTSKIKKIYSLSVVDNQVLDGRKPYPNPDFNSKAGMAVELKDVCFSYPGANKTSNALNNVSLTIDPGQLVVIVGANGGGKSTIIKLLSRLYDPTSGQIFIDGVPSDQYRLSDLRQAICILSQDNHIYPLSLFENIAMGNTNLCTDLDAVTKAATLGGASGFISKLKDGLETVLDPLTEIISFNLQGYHEHPLHVKMKELKKKIDISGGERQRVVGARAFMRFTSGRIKFVAVDEPSSALDAEGELQLFENLIKERNGKTMVLVTHRFGHLTRHADKIICMKDGSVAECGTHAELIKMDGEYAKLYQIQASAFEDGSKPSIRTLETSLL